MKKILSLFLITAILITAGCTSSEQTVPTQSGSEATTGPIEIVTIDPNLVDAVTDNWVALEMAFVSNKEYKTQ